MYKIMVTGGSSMIGRPVVEILRAAGHIVDAVPHSECDLLSYNQTYNRIVNFGPNYIMHLAGWNGGISWNKQYPAEIYFRTVQMALNVYRAAVESKYGISKILGVLASCSYPDMDGGYFEEKDIHSGKPNNSVECHGLAKRVIFDYGRQVNIQHGIKCVAAILTNSFGPFDSYHPEKTKVVGALIRKFVEARDNNLPEVICWGSGRPKRQLIYSRDAAKILVDLLFQYDNHFLPINVGSPFEYEISIFDLTRKIANLVGYKGNILWDTNKQDGQMRKFISVDRLNMVTKPVYTPLDDALAETIEWYTSNKEIVDGKTFF